MNYKISSIIVLAFVACSAPQDDEATMPKDVAGLQQLLKEKQSDLQALEQEIAEIESLVAEMDPSLGEVSKVVTTTQINASEFNHYVTIQGNVTADDIVNASSEMGGRIIKLTVDEGDYVKKGQLIAEIDLESIDKQVAELQKSLELANDVFDRQSRLWEQKIGSEIQYLQAKNNKERLEKSIESLEFQQTKSTVYAPIGGAVDLVFSKEGEMTSPGAPIVQILNTARLKVEADAPENLLGSVRRGDRVKVILPALNQEMERRITQLGRRIDPSNRTFRIEVTIPSKGMIKPNLLAELLVNDYSEKDVIQVPIELVQREISGKEYIIALGEDKDGHFAKKKYVLTGDSYDGKIIVTEGLTIGETIVLLGARGLTEGERIKVVPTETANQES